MPPRLPHDNPMNKVAPPPWLHPAFRLIVGTGEWTCAALLEKARSWPDGPLSASGHDLPTLIAALIAGWCHQVPVTLLRGGLPAPPDMVSTGRLLLLETSGTTGTPKRITWSFDTLQQAIDAPRHGDGGRWLLTYDACGFAGLQVLLTAAKGGGVLLADPGADAATLVQLAVAHQASHISATPSFWRLLLLSPATPPLTRITLGGEAVDQAVLDALAERFPGTPIRCIYASTELGRLFTVTDGRQGFPASWLTHPPGPHLFRIQNDQLQAKSDGGWQDTGDMVEIDGDRVLFRGRNDLIVNVAGTKVNPMLAETRLLSLAGVKDAVAYGIASPITGAILAADIVAPDWAEDPNWRSRVTQALADLPAAARPRRLRLLPTLPLSAAGKKRRIAEEA